MLALINTIVRGRSFEEAMQTAGEIVRRIEPATATSGLTVLGPAPAPLVRLRGEHRVQFLLKGGRRGDMRRVLEAALAGMPNIRRRVTVDVDPLSIL
jgi:primosomal protein N' (replication factor Y)